MSQYFEPRLRPVEIISLRPTQISVGFREVEEKRHHWRTIAEKKGPDFLGGHMVPVVTGPKGKLFLIDNHHLARALHEAGWSMC